VDTDQLALAIEPVAPPVEIRPSARRRKTVAAHWEGDTIVVLVPQRMSRKLRQEYADHLAAKLLAQRRATHPSDVELLARALDLLARYLPEVPVPAAVNWTSRETSRWGSCSLGDRTIRLSDSLRGVPSWVLDAVLVHELAHLVCAGHDDRFKALAARHPRAADAEIFLAGYQLGLGR
jgi:hypothetical protein